MTITPAALVALSRGEMGNFIAASTEGGIEAQEAQGQKDLCSASKLPKECSDNCKAILEDAGIVFGEDVDDLFCAVTLPEGWALKPTEHSMWSNLLDENGYKRAGVFYKAAFYDRRAHFSACKRFSISNYHDVHDDGSRSIVVMDAKQATPLMDFGRADRDYEAAEPLQEEAEKWLFENYPDCRDAGAYWSDD